MIVVGIGVAAVTVAANSEGLSAASVVEAVLLVLLLPRKKLCLLVQLLLRKKNNVGNILLQLLAAWLSRPLGARSPLLLRPPRLGHAINSRKHWRWRSWLCFSLIGLDTTVLVTLYVPCRL